MTKKITLLLSVIVSVFVLTISLSSISFAQDATWVCPVNPSIVGTQFNCNSRCGDRDNGPVGCQMVTQSGPEWYCPVSAERFDSQVTCDQRCPISCSSSRGGVSSGGSGSSGGGTAQTPARSAPGVNRFANDQTPYPHSVTPPAGGPISDVESFLYILTALIQFAEAVFWILAVGFGLYGAYLYLFSQGSSEKAGQARKVFIYAAIASLLAIVAYGVPGLVQSFVLGY